MTATNPRSPKVLPSTRSPEVLPRGSTYLLTCGSTSFPRGVVSAEVLPSFRRYFLPSARHWRVRGQRRLPHDGNVAEVLPSCAESSRRKYFLPSGGTSFRPPGIGAFAGNDDYHMTATNPRSPEVLPSGHGSTYLLTCRSTSFPRGVVSSEVLPSFRRYFLASARHWRVRGQRRLPQST